MKLNSKIEELIECLECHEEFLSLNSHLQRIHGITTEEYKKKHGLSKISSEVLLDVLKEITIVSQPLAAKASRLYWSDNDNRYNKAKKIETMQKERYKDPEEKEKFLLSAEPYREIRRLKTRMLKKPCAYCGNFFNPKIQKNGRTGGVNLFWRERWFCNSDCKNKMKKGKKPAQFFEQLKKYQQSFFNNFGSEITIVETDKSFFYIGKTSTGNKIYDGFDKPEFKIS